MNITKQHIDWVYTTLEGVNEAHNLGEAARQAVDNQGFWNAVGFYLLGVAIQGDFVDPDNYHWKDDTFVVQAINAEEAGAHAMGQFVSSYLKLEKRPESEKESKECAS